MDLRSQKKKLTEERLRKGDEIESILNQAQKENRDTTELEAAKVDKLLAESEAIAHRVNNLDSIETAVTSIAKKMDLGEKTPAVAARKVRGFADAQQAYDVGCWFRGMFAGDHSAWMHAKSKGLITNSMNTGVNPSGGFMVPESMESAIVTLREQFGVARRECQIVEMGAGRVVLPRLAGEVSASFVGELGDITPSDPTLNQVVLDAKKIAAMTVMSSELDEDAVVSVSEMLAQSIAFSFARLEDQCLFNGDGTSPFGGINGLAGALQAGSRHTATSQSTIAALTLTHFEQIIGKAKMYGPNAKWYMSRAFWANGPMRLVNAAGGVTAMDLTEGVSEMFLGYPVVFGQDLHSDTGSSTGDIGCYFGDLRTGTMLGSRRGITVALDSSRYFEQDAIALRVTERFDINVHDRGDATNAGGIIALVFG